MPDYFNGDPIPQNMAGFDMNVWRGRHPANSSQAIIDATLKYARDTLKVKKFGVVGYCWGGPFVVRQLAAGKGVDAGFMAHPGEFTNEEANAVAAPLSLAAAGQLCQGEYFLVKQLLISKHYTESDFSLSSSRRHEVEDLFLKKKATYQVNLYSGVTHGFAVSVDLNDRKQVFAKESAFNQALRWFYEYLKGGAKPASAARKTDQRINHDFLPQRAY